MNGKLFKTTIECPHCYLWFTGRYARDNHRMLAHPDETSQQGFRTDLQSGLGKYFCTSLACDKTYIYKMGVKRHLERHPEHGDASLKHPATAFGQGRRTDIAITEAETLRLWLSLPNTLSTFEIGKEILLAAHYLKLTDNQPAGHSDITAMMPPVFETTPTWKHLEADIKASNGGLQYYHYSEGVVDDMNDDEFIRFLHQPDTEFSRHRPATLIDFSASAEGLLSCNPRQHPGMKSLGDPYRTIDEGRWQNLVSQPGSITTIHFDPVWFSWLLVHIVGHKFWFWWPSTPKNLEIYRHMHEAGPSFYKALLLMEGGTMKICRPGTVIWMPPGQFHAVVTPESAFASGYAIVNPAHLDLSWNFAKWELGVFRDLYKKRSKENMLIKLDEYDEILTWMIKRSKRKTGLWCTLEVREKLAEIWKWFKKERAELYTLYSIVS